MSEERKGDLSVTGRARFDFIAGLVQSDFRPPARVVEYGAAPGDQIAELARLGYEATAVDLGEASDQWGPGREGRYARMLDVAGVTNVTWDLEKTPYPLPDETFDAALLTEVLEHLREYPAHSLQEIRRTLRPGGRLYLTTPNAAYLVNRFRLLSGRSVSTPLPDWIGGLPHARHAREYTFAETRELLNYVGFRVVSLQSRHFQIRTGRSSPVAQLVKTGVDRLARRVPTLGPSIIAVAENPG